MPRALRPQFAGALYHITSRGNRGDPIFLDRLERRRFLEVLAQTIDRFRWRCFAYCLMTNHYHLVVMTRDPNVSPGMHYLNGAYARWFNWRHGYEGHLFQRRFHSAVIASDWHLLEACRYVVMNPVRAGLVARPADWVWSSYRATVGTNGGTPAIAVDEVLKFFGTPRATARETFRLFVDDGPSRRPF